MRKRIFAAQLLLLVGVGFYFGCNKTDHPFGVYAPRGLDIPSPTATPLAGAIDVFVQDGSSDIAGVSIVLTDPNNKAATVVTAGAPSYYAPYNPSPLVPGNWKAEVYPQPTLRYGYSSVTFTVTNSGANVVTFLANNQTIGVSPVTQSFLSISGSTYVYNITYNQPGNLDIPVSVTFNALPSGFVWSPSSLYLNMTNPTKPVTITNNVGCYNKNIPVTFTAKDIFGGYPIIKYGLFSKGFPVQFYLTWTGSPGGAPINVNTVNDCGYAWPLTIVVAGGCFTCFAGTASNGTTFDLYVSNPNNWTTIDLWGPNGQHFTDYRSFGSMSSGLTFGYVQGY